MMTNKEAMKLALEGAANYIDALGGDSRKYRQALANEALDKKAENARELGLDYEPAQPKYRRGDRLICLETEEYCVIHISGTDRQWVKFPDTHIGVYKNEQLAELFELLPKEIEIEQPAQQEPFGYFKAEPFGWTDCAESDEGAVALYERPQPAQQEPVAYRVKWPAIGGGYKWLMVDKPLMEKEGFANEALYTSPPAQRTWVGLTDADKQEAFDETQEASGGFWEFADYLEAKLKEKNT